MKITKITDPFGRFATFEYEGQGRLSKITDVIGITSHFTYESGDFISELTTPYGTTHFRTGPTSANIIGKAYDLWIEATDPLGGTEHVEYKAAQGVADGDLNPPPGFSPLNLGMFIGRTMHWDKRAMAFFPDETKAVVTTWLSEWPGVSTATVKAAKFPREGSRPLRYRLGRRVTHTYREVGNYLVTLRLVEGAREAACTVSVTLQR